MLTKAGAVDPYLTEKKGYASTTEESEIYVGRSTETATRYGPRSNHLCPYGT